ncbi:MAG: hypothetical protein IPP03_22580 [Dechloromonas sp.]|nr:hypothetical protein [Candidatus Dechloromonas phosphoritropha]
MNTIPEFVQRISALMKLSAAAERMQQGDAIDQEIIDAFLSAPADVIDEIEAELATAGLPPLPMQLNPGSLEFRAAMKRFCETQNYGDDEADRQELMAASVTAMRLAPPWWKAEMDRMFDEIFDVTPDGDTDDGVPTFSVGTVAHMCGKSEAEIMNDLVALEDAGFQVLNTEKIHGIN